MALNNLVARRASKPGSKASRSTSTACCTRRKVSRGSRFFPSRISATPSGCSSSPCCSTRPLAWVRAQPGHHSLRAILYMDEIFGYFPPVPTRPQAPLLTLLKQARAFGLGVVLATQNPVDLDYKGLANTGTWFIGRLQTERDKARLLDGLQSASAESGARFDRAQMERTLSSLGSRVFLMNNVHEDAPELFESRWTMSYLRVRSPAAQIQTLMAARKAAAPAIAPTPAAQPAAATARPVLPPEIAQYSFRSAAPCLARPATARVLLGIAQAHSSTPRPEWTRSATCRVTPIGADAVAVNWTKRRNWIWDRTTWRRPRRRTPHSPNCRRLRRIPKLRGMESRLRFLAVPHAEAGAVPLSVA